MPPLGDGPWVFDTSEQHKVRVSVVTKGLSHPWAIAFLPDGAMLVTERPGRLRVIRNGVLDPTPIAGVPQVRTDGNGGLMDVALHPRFTENSLVYLTYTKPVENGRGTPTLARGRLFASGAREMVEHVRYADFLPGDRLAIVRRVGGRDRLEVPQGTVTVVALAPSLSRAPLWSLEACGIARPRR